MKATHAHLLGEFTGHLDELIYYRNKKNGKLYVRRRFKFKNHPAHLVFTKIIQNIYALAPSEEYKQNLQTYVALFNTNLPEGKKPLQHLDKCLHNIDVRLAKSFSRNSKSQKHSHWDQIYSQNLPAISVKQAIEAGLLAPVKNYELLTGEL